MNLDDVVPGAQFEVVQRRISSAPAEALWDELTAITMASLPLGWFLTKARYLPARLAGVRRPPLAPQTFLEETPIPVLASERPSLVISAGLSRAWRPSGDTGDVPLLDAAALREFSEPGWIKVAMAFRLEPAQGGTTMTCTTRIVATDPRTRRIFAAYWLVIRAGSAAIRSEVLRAVARRAEGRTGM
jgi:hypothetical protein